MRGFGSWMHEKCHPGLARASPHGGHGRSPRTYGAEKDALALVLARPAESERVEGVEELAVQSVRGGESSGAARDSLLFGQTM